MILTAHDQALNEEDSSDIFSSSSLPSSLCSASSSLAAQSSPPPLGEEVHQVVELQRRISQTYPSAVEGGSALSKEALWVLSNTSMSLLNLKKLHDHSTLVSPLYKQLEALRDMIPPSHTQAGESSSPCVITCALEYLEKLRIDIQSLHEIMQEPSNLYERCISTETLSRMDPYNVLMQDQGAVIKVVHTKDDVLHIHVRCEKRKDLLTKMMIALETQGLVFDKFDASCNDFLVLDGITTQDSVKMVSEETVRKLLWRTIGKN